jgi:WD40 repeat protein
MKTIYMQLSGQYLVCKTVLALLLLVLMGSALAQERPQLVAQTGHTDSITSVAFSPDGKTALSGSWDRTLRLWDLASGRELKALNGHANQVRSVAFSPDGRTALSGSWDRTLRLWDLASGRELMTLSGHTDSDSVYSIAFGPDGRKALSGSKDKTLRLWDLASGQELMTLSGHTSQVTSVAISPDGRKALSGSEDKTLRLWDLASGQELMTLSGHTGQVTSVAISPDGRTALLGKQDKSLRLWDLASGRALMTLTGHTDWVNSIALSPDGRKALSGSEDKTLRHWDLATGRELKTLSGHTGQVTSVAFSPDGKTGLSGSWDRTLRLWDLASGKELMTLSGYTDWVTSVAISPDGRTALSGSLEHTLRLWDLASGKQLMTLSGNADWVNAVAISPDGRTALSGSTDKTLRLWDLASGQELMTLGGHTGRVTSVAISPDGKIALSGSGDHTLRLWDVASGRELKALNGHANQIHSVAFSPDGKTAFSGSWDTRTKLWRVSDGAELATLVNFTDGSWAVTEPGGRYDSSSNGENPNLHWVVGLTPIGIEQLKERYYDPGLLAKIMGFNKEPLRTVPPFEAAAVKLPPSVELSLPSPASASSTLATALARLTDEGGGIGRVRVRLNGKELLADASAQLRPAVDGKARELRLALPGDRLLPGTNTLDVMAFNADNHIQSRLVSLSVPGPDAAGRGAVRADAPVQLGTTAGGPPPTLFVIAAGVSQYAAPDQRLNLQFAGKDAADLTQALMLGGQRLFGAGKVHAQLLTDAPTDSLKSAMASTNAGNTVQIAAPTRAALQAAFARVAQQAKPGDILVVTLAGHGVMTPGLGLDTGDYHYLTREAQSTDLSDPAVRALWGVSSSELTEWTKAIKANKQVLVLDTCAAGGAVDKLIAQRNLPGSHTIALERLKDRTGFHILAGAAADRVSYEASRYGQGLLTYALLSGLRGAALREGEYADISTLFQYAVDEVPKLAKGIGGVQRPLVASPKGSSFDIGRLTADDKKRVPLAQIRPLILRADIQSEDFKDALRLQARLNAALREQNQSAARGALMFVDADEHPDGWKLRARYRKQGDGYWLEGVLFQGEMEMGRVKVELKGDEARQVGELMAAVRKGVGE